MALVSVTSTDVVAAFGFVVHLLAGINCMRRLGAKCLLVNTHGHARNAVTPLKIVGLAVLVNVVRDWLLCTWPLRLGCAGAAAAATALATLTSCAAMLRALSRQNLLPAVRLPARR
jgi:hypothetical protein